MNRQHDYRVFLLNVFIAFNSSTNAQQPSEIMPVFFAYAEEQLEKSGSQNINRIHTFNKGFTDTLTPKQLMDTPLSTYQLASLIGQRNTHALINLPQTILMAPFLLMIDDKHFDNASACCIPIKYHVLAGENALALAVAHSNTDITYAEQAATKSMINGLLDRGLNPDSEITFGFVGQDLVSANFVNRYRLLDFAQYYCSTEVMHILATALRKQPEKNSIATRNILKTIDAEMFFNTQMTNLLTHTIKTSERPVQYVHIEPSSFEEDAAIFQKTLSDDPNTQLIIHWVDTRHIEQSTAMQEFTCFAKHFPKAQLSLYFHADLKEYLKFLKQHGMPSADIAITHCLCEQETQRIKTIYSRALLNAKPTASINILFNFSVWIQISAQKSPEAFEEDGIFETSTRLH